MRALTAPIGAGDLIDRIAILSINAERTVVPARSAAAGWRDMNSSGAEDREDILPQALVAFSCDVLRRLNLLTPIVPFEDPRGPVDSHVFIM